MCWLFHPDLLREVHGLSLDCCFRLGHLLGSSVSLLQTTTALANFGSPSFLARAEAERLSSALWVAAGAVFLLLSPALLSKVFGRSWSTTATATRV